ncbi:MAG: SurA N-terminal domain-containing protein [Treponema sp.]|nr:SurA N-terminal domain-containing protein [Treponema sp.]
MKKILLSAVFILGLAGSVFAQNDLQALAVVKLNKSETITVRTLKSRVGFVLKQYEPYGVSELSAEQRQQILESLIDEKLINQAAAKEGIVVTDSEVNASFLDTFSQQLGQQVTESQLSELIKKQTGKTLDEYLKDNSGMNTSEYKAYLRSQLVAQKYVYSKKQAELSKVAASDEEIRKAYDLNKATFVWNDMMKLYLVMVPKGSDETQARAKATDFRNQYAKDAAYGAKLKSDSENGKSFRAGELIVAKTSQQAVQLGWNYDKIIELFQNNAGFVSDITETNTDFQFYAVIKKYDAKMLSISDTVQPESNVTVYEYIKNNLTRQKQSQFLAEAAQQVANSLDTPANVERKKTGDELVKLLSW